MSSEYWLISIPGDKTPAQAYEALNNATSKQNTLSQNFKFPIPDLKVKLSILLLFIFLLMLI